MVDGRHTVVKKVRVYKTANSFKDGMQGRLQVGFSTRQKGGGGAACCRRWARPIGRYTSSRNKNL
jgi:hypothetical protein